METIKDRLKQVMDAMGLKPLTPASTCDGITKSMMDKLWKNSTGAVSSNILVPFCNHYTNVNCNWLLRGHGEMFLKDSEIQGSEKGTDITLGTEEKTNDAYYKHKLIELLKADMAIARAESIKKELYAQIAGKI